MSNYFEEIEEVEEYPVDASFLVGGEEEACDPLLITDPGVSAQDPLEISTPVIGGARTEPVDVIPKQEFPVPTIVSVSSNTTSNTLRGSLPPPPLPVPLSTLDMSFEDFANEMEQQIHDIVKESIGLFGRDPREYHPFYLRIFKYITIGKRLGYIAEDKAHVDNIWSGFFKFAEAQYEASNQKTASFTGERSAYATFLLTRKVVINGKVITHKRNEFERQKMFKELENNAKRIRDEWNATTRVISGGSIRDDMKTRLKFFDKCRLVTHPADCLKMNNLWSKFLSEEGFYSRGRGKGPAKDPPKSITGRNLPLVKEEHKAVDKECGQAEEDKCNEESKKALRRFIIKVIVAPSSPSKESSVPSSSVETSSTLPTTAAVSPSPPTSPVAASPPPSPAHSSPPASPPPEPESVSETSAQILKRKRVKMRVRKRPRPVKAVSKPPTITSVLNKKKKLLGKLASRKGTNSEAYIAQQLKLEKIISQPKCKLLTSVVRRKITTKKIDSSAEKKTDHAMKASRREVSRTKSKVPKKISPSPSSLIKKVNKINNKTTTKFQLLKKKRRLVQQRSKNSVELQKRVEKAITQKNAKSLKPTTVSVSSKGDEKGEEKVEESETPTTLSREESLARKRRTWQFYGKYHKIKTVCEVCNDPLSFGSLGKHLKNAHGIVEDGDLWICPVCGKSDITTRFSWLGHIEMQHDGKVNMEEMIEVARKINTKEHWSTGEVQMPLYKKPIVPAKPLPNPVVKKDKNEIRREICDECGNSYNSRYIAIHKLQMHNPERRKPKCPMCLKELSDARSIWNHYCQYHLTGRQLQIVDIIHQIEPEKVTKQTDAAAEISTTCEHCGKNLSNPQTLERHLRNVHGEGLLRENYHQCPHCAKQFKVKETMVSHIKRIHEDTIKSKCEQCGGKDLQSAGKLWRHLIDVHGTSASDAAAYCEVTFSPCVYCGLELLEGRQQSNHMKSDHPDKFDEFMATHKLMEFKDKDMQQILTYQERRKLRKRAERKRLREEGIGPAWLKKERLKGVGTCKDCGVYFPKFLTRHRRLEHGKIDNEAETPCPIEECNVRLKGNRSLKCHLRSCHTKEIEVKIAEKRVVKIMEKTATGTIYLCTLCDEYLHHYEEVKVHMVALHPDIFDGLLGDDVPVPPRAARPPPPEFQCPHCSEKYPSDEQVRSHVETSHAELCWRCPECDKVMLDPGDFDKHFLEEHSDNNNGQSSESREQMETEEYFKLRTTNLSNNIPRRKARKSVTDKKREERHYAYRKLKGRCEICKTKMSLYSMANHVKFVHGVEEDGDPIVCTICENGREFKFQTHRARVSYVYHMENSHGMDQSELIEKAFKVNTKVDWRTLEIKNPQGKGRYGENRVLDLEKIERKEIEPVRNKRSKRTAPKKVAKQPNWKAIETETKSQKHDDDDEENPAEKRKKVKTNMVKKKNSLPVRVSGRTRGPPKKYKIESDSDTEDDDMTGLSGEDIGGDDSDFDIGISPKRTTRGSRGGRGDVRRSGRIADKPVRERRRRKLYNSDEEEAEEEQGTPVVENIERDRRLVIKLTRLTEDELTGYYSGHREKGNGKETDQNVPINNEQQQKDADNEELLIPPGAAAVNKTEPSSEKDAEHKELDPLYLQ